MDCSLPGSSLYGILQARGLEWVAISFSRGSSWLRDRTRVFRIAGRHFSLWDTREAPRILEWIALSSFRGSSQPRDQTRMSHIAGRFFFSLFIFLIYFIFLLYNIVLVLPYILYHLSHQGSPITSNITLILLHWIYWCVRKSGVYFGHGDTLLWRYLNIVIFLSELILFFLF